MTENLMLAALFGGFAAIAVAERILPHREFKPAPLWRIRGLVAFAVTLAASSLVPITLDPLLEPYTLIDGSGLGTVGGALLGFGVYQVISYFWHRALHTVPLLWRFHQTHHSAERIDVWSAWLFHPVDIFLFTAVGSVALIVVLGVTVEAALLTAMVGNSLAMFQHSALRTPRWLGYIVQRPENHTVHHARGLHGKNYGDLAFMDMLFGTWENPPASAEFETGFWDGASTRLGRLLVGADVTTPPAIDERRVA